MKRINNIGKDEIKSRLKFFEEDKGANERYASFDYCFNYFQGFKNKAEIANDDNIQNSCFQLGFYLASWGMYRGSTFLLQKSVKVFENLIKYISDKDCDVWDIDVDNYTPENILKLVKCGERIKKELGLHTIKKADGTSVEKEATDTLVTKIMLGVFGNVPAFDGYFKAGSNLDTFREHSLNEIKDFYTAPDHKTNIDNKAMETKTFNYHVFEKSERLYTKAKIVDMIFFAKGFQEDQEKRKEKEVK